MSIGKQKIFSNLTSRGTSADGLAGPDALVRTVSMMPERMNSLVAGTLAEPLSAEEMTLADRVMRRLHEQIRSFLSSLPPEARNASGLARFLGVDRTTCQRLVYTASRPYLGLVLIDRLPGTRGLRQVIEAARLAKNGRLKLDHEQIAAFETAVDRLEEAVRSMGGSQSAFSRRVASTPRNDGTLAGSESGEEQGHAKRRLFEAAAELTGRHSNSWVAVYVYSPHGNATGGSCEKLNVARVHGLLGHVARSNAVPLTFHNFTSKRTENGADEELAGQAFHSLMDEGEDDPNIPATVLRNFTSQPPPVISARQPGEYLVQAIDTDPSVSGEPVDFMLGTRNVMAHPALQPPRIEEVWAMINFPVRQLVFDVYLHRDLARTAIPSLDQHLWRPDFAANVGDRWQTRFADGPRLEVLGTGTSKAATPANVRHSELTAFLFQRLQLDADRFIGYRCAVEYPMWRTGYCMSFDFNPDDSGE